MGRSSEPDPLESAARTPSPPTRPGRRPSWRARLAPAVGALMLCMSGTAAAAPPATPAAPTPGSAPLYISDYTANQVLKLPPGGPQTTVPTSDLSRPTEMVLDPAGNLYISDTVNSRIVKVPADGGPQATVPTTGLLRPLGLALDGDNNLYIADSFNDRVVKFPLDGGAQTTVPTSGLLHPYGLALDADGELYIADFVNDRVVQVPVAGGPQSTVPTSGLSQPAGLALDVDGDLYIADSGNNRIVKVPVAGSQTTVPTSGLSSPQGVAVDALDNLYVADFGNDRVVKVAASGGQSTVPVTGLSTPVGLAFPPVPAPPSDVSAVPGDAQATVTFTPSTSESVTGYTVTATDATDPSRGGQTARGAGSPINVTGLTPGDHYTFTVTATNAARATSLSSVPSPAVTIPSSQSARTRLRARDATGELHLLPPKLTVGGLSATLTTAGGTPLDGRTITFTNVGKSRTLCSAATDNRGVATCDATVNGTRTALRLSDDLRRHGYRAAFAGTGAYRPSEDTARVRTTPRR